MTSVRLWQQRERELKLRAMRRLLVVTVAVIALAIIVDRLINSILIIPAVPSIGEEACNIAHKFVSDRLVAPATADFQRCASTNITEEGAGVYEISGYVDAQNLFGAKLRGNYIATVRLDRYDDKTRTNWWKLDDLRWDRRISLGERGNLN
jgi:hypothetical protein